MRPVIWLGVAGCAAPEPAVDPGCSTHEPLSRIDDVVPRIQALPEATIPCLVDSLPRTLPVVAVASLFSAQPGTWRSPRVFVTLPDLVVSVALDGDGAHLVEFGEWIDARRTVKGELVFPLASVDASAPYAHLDEGDSSPCGVCHVGEVADGAPGRFVSDVIRPQVGSLVPLGDLIDESVACDPSNEPSRCALLGAIVGLELDLVDGAFREP